MSKNTKKIYKKRQYSLKSKNNRRIRVRGKSKSRTKSHGGTRGGGGWRGNETTQAERIKTLKENARIERQTNPEKREKPFIIHQDVGWNGTQTFNKEIKNDKPYVRLLYNPDNINESQYILIKDGSNNISVYGPDAEKILDVGYILSKFNKCSTWYTEDDTCENNDCDPIQHDGTRVVEIDNHTYNSSSEKDIGTIFNSTVRVTKTTDQSKKYQTYYFYENSEFVNNPAGPTAFAMYTFNEDDDNRSKAIQNTDNADDFLKCS